MKKTLLLCLLAIGSTNTMADVYIGVDYGATSNTTEIIGGTNDVDETNKYKDISVKLGIGEDGDWKGQIRVSSLSYDKTIFDSSHKKLIEVSFDGIKEFEIQSVQNLYPFIKFGFGIGSMSIDGYSESSITSASFNLGVGISYNVIDHINLIGGVDYIGRSWQDVQISTYTLSTFDSGAKPYIGVNYTF
ncbi:outer membrane beta-barrel protein [Sulfurimonas sp.]|uniref:outer membrane beta-barrel protein n=1 Tax=Sulfurimonas sp. TaxID=2022749 RepID=UPI003D0D5363